MTPEVVSAKLPSAMSSIGWRIGREATSPMVEGCQSEEVEFMTSATVKRVFEVDAPLEEAWQRLAEGDPQTAAVVSPLMAGNGGGPPPVGGRPRGSSTVQDGSDLLIGSADASQRLLPTGSAPAQHVQSHLRFYWVTRR
jgi:hypothetical protein